MGNAYQGHVHGELHPDAHGGDEDDHRHGAQLDVHQAHEAKQLHGHQGQHQHLGNTDAGVNRGAGTAFRRDASYHAKSFDSSKTVKHVLLLLLCIYFLSSLLCK